MFTPINKFNIKRVGRGCKV